MSLVLTSEVRQQGGRGLLTLDLPGASALAEEKEHFSRHF